jgi:hypothetical protein
MATKWNCNKNGKKYSKILGILGNATKGFGTIMDYCRSYR